jgi:uncharacterized membrane protein YbjE (DUF340 family)
MKSSAIILVCFASGILGAASSLLPPFLLSSDLPKYALCALLFLVGVGIGSSPEAWQLLRRLSFKAVLVPAAAIVGTLVGVASVSFGIPGVSLRESLAIGSGFGYYSLSSILVAQFRGDMLGVLALLANIMREIVTLLMAPVLARYFGDLAPIAAGGATAMDTTLPVIIKSVGTQYAIVAVSSGMLLTLLVPVLTSLLL